MSNFERHSSCPGFVYFNSNNSTISSANSSGSTELSFSNSYDDNSPSRSQPFSPSCYSSPKYNSSPRNNFNVKQSYRHTPKGNNWNRSFSHNPSGDSFSGSYQRSQKQTQQKSFYQGRSFDEERDMSAYIDPSCMRDPWEELVERAGPDDSSKEVEERTTQVDSDSSQELPSEVPADEAVSSEVPADKAVPADQAVPSKIPVDKAADDVVEVGVGDSDGSSSGSSDESCSSGSSSSSCVTVEGGKT